MRKKTAGGAAETRGDVDKGARRVTTFVEGRWCESGLGLKGASIPPRISGVGPDARGEGRRGNATFPFTLKVVIAANALRAIYPRRREGKRTSGS